MEKPSQEWLCIAYLKPGGRRSPDRLNTAQEYIYFGSFSGCADDVFDMPVHFPSNAQASDHQESWKESDLPALLMRLVQVSADTHTIVIPTKEVVAKG